MVITLTVQGYFNHALYNALMNFVNPVGNEVSLVFDEKYKEVIQVYLKRFKVVEDKYEIAGNSVAVKYLK